MVAKSEKFAVFPEDFATPCQFSCLARCGRSLKKRLTLSLFWQRAISRFGALWLAVR
jgi:hypothetical protein